MALAKWGRVTVPAIRERNKRRSIVLHERHFDRLSRTKPGPGWSLLLPSVHRRDMLINKLKQAREEQNCRDFQIIGAGGALKTFLIIVRYSRVQLQVENVRRRGGAIRRESAAIFAACSHPEF